MQSLYDWIQTQMKILRVRARKFVSMFSIISLRIFSTKNYNNLSYHYVYSESSYAEELTDKSVQRYAVIQRLAAPPPASHREISDTTYYLSSFLYLSFSVRYRREFEFRAFFSLTCVAINPSKMKINSCH